MRKPFLLASVLTLGLLGCAHVTVRAMDEGEAVNRGYAWCSNHGFRCQLTRVALTGRLWQLDYAAESPRRAGNLHLAFDAYNRALYSVAEPPFRPAPPPPAPRLMSEQEAVQRGYGLCGQRGYTCRLTGARLAGNVWELNFAAQSPQRLGNLHVEMDGFSRQVVREQEPPARVVLAPPPGARPMSSDEATRRGYDFCRSRHYNCRLQDVDFAGGRVWRLNYQVLGRPHGRVHVEYDAYSRAQLNLNEDVRF